jgi:glucose 1-dehydrogenase
MKNLLAAFGVRVERAEVSQETGLRLEDKVAIVTGGDTGIGRAICVAMAHEGARVVIDYHGEATRAENLVNQIQASGGTAYAVGADVTKPEDLRRIVDAAVRRYGKLDIMVNNAETREPHSFLETPLEVYEKVIATNLTGVWLGSQVAAEKMVEQKTRGRIINISSIYEEVATPSNAPYCIAKAGVRMLTRTISLELASFGITVNNVCPGAIDAQMDIDAREIPMHRMGKPEEVAAMCVYLASDDAAYVTGASLFIDGGMSNKSSSL